MLDPETRRTRAADAAHPGALLGIQLLATALLVVGSLSMLTYSALRSPDTPFVVDGVRATWIAAPRPVVPETLLVAPGYEQTSVFARSFELERAPAVARVDARALGSLTLEVNGVRRVVTSDPRACLKRSCSMEIGDMLRDGPNRIVATVVRPDGVALLRLALEAGGVSVVTDEGWEVSAPAASDQEAPPRPVPAVRADDTRPFAGAASGPTVLQAVGDGAGPLCVFFVIGAAGFLLARRARRGRIGGLAVPAALSLAVVFWAYVFAVKIVSIPIEIGHDAPSHVNYARSIATHGRLPLADEGFSMYHPPLHYLASAGLLRTFAPARDGLGERILLKLVPALSCLGMVVVTLMLIRKLYPGDERLAAFGVVLAATSPLSLYMAAYPSNEPLHAFLVGAALLVSAHVFLTPVASARALWALASVLALAALTKYTGVFVTLIVLAFVALKLLVVEGRGLGRAAATLGLMAVWIALLAGGPYFRNWWHFGDPFVWNVDMPGGLSWWQPPSFRTAGYYLGFGDSLRHPYFSQFGSYWDAMYSGLWGEGLPPATGTVEGRHPYWNYRMMSATYALAVPATLLMGAGFVCAIRGALRDPLAGRAVVLALVTTLVYVLAFSSVQVSMRYPFWGGARATYMLGLVVPGVLCGALGFTAFDRWLERHRLVAVRAVYYGWFGALVGCVVLAFAS